MPAPFLKMSGVGLARERPCDVVGGHEVDLVRGDLLPQRRLLPGRADGWILLEPRAHSKDVVLVEDEVLHARLRAHPYTVLPVAPHVIEPARERAVHDVAAHPGRPRDLEDGDVRDELGERGTACTVRLRGAAPFSRELLGEASHDVWVLVVERHRKPGLRDGREDLEELSRVVPRKANGMVLVGRYLEGAGAGLGELRDPVRARSLAGGGVERDVHDREPLDRADLAAQTLDRVDRMGVDTNGMSTIVVTPPAAAAREASPSPSMPAALPACT